MKKWIYVCLFVVLALPCNAYAIEIIDAAITSDISERSPVDSLNTVKKPVDQLFCFTHVVGAEDDTWITHVWYHEGKEMARVRLPVSSSNWRTWSSKKILPQWDGQWQVHILDAQGQARLIVPFMVE
ncbi:MAG: DUF2914 domain-containing protein [Desulfuromonadaceae bacterium]|nr:DUF2914 domain-containing protein [Desulfuromonadaceae bacterium]